MSTCKIWAWISWRVREGVYGPMETGLLSGPRLPMGFIAMPCEARPNREQFASQSSRERRGRDPERSHEHRELATTLSFVQGVRQTATADRGERARVGPKV